MLLRPQKSPYFVDTWGWRNLWCRRIIMAFLSSPLGCIYLYSNMSVHWSMLWLWHCSDFPLWLALTVISSLTVSADFHLGQKLFSPVYILIWHWRHFRQFTNHSSIPLPMPEYQGTRVISFCKRQLEHKTSCRSPGLWLSPRNMHPRGVMECY